MRLRASPRSTVQSRPTQSHPVAAIRSSQGAPPLVKTMTGMRAALQGNIDPAVLLASPEAVRREVERAIESFGSGAGHVFNLGHGVPQHTPPENVAALVSAVHELSPKFH